MREIHNIQEGLGQAPASTPVDVRCLHRLYNGLANALLRDLAAPAALDPGHEGVSSDGHRCHEAGVSLDNLDSAQGNVAKRCDEVGNH